MALFFVEVLKEKKNLFPFFLFLPRGFMNWKVENLREEERFWRRSRVRKEGVVAVYMKEWEKRWARIWPLLFAFSSLVGDKKKKVGLTLKKEHLQEEFGASFFRAKTWYLVEKREPLHGPIWLAQHVHALNTCWLPNAHCWSPLDDRFHC